jgi:hypothetical protein
MIMGKGIYIIFLEGLVQVCQSVQNPLADRAIGLCVDQLGALCPRPLCSVLLCLVLFCCVLSCLVLFCLFVIEKSTIFYRTQQEYLIVFLSNSLFIYMINPCRCEVSKCCEFHSSWSAPLVWRHSGRSTGTRRRRPKGVIIH